MFLRFGALLILFWSCTAIAQGNPADSLTIDQAIKMVTDNHPMVLGAIQGVAASDALIEQSQSAFYPQVSGIGSYAYIGPVPTFDLPGAGAMELAPHNNYDFHVGLQQQLFDFGRRSTALELARSGRGSAVESIEAVKAGLAYQTVDIFYSILYLEQNVSVVDEQINALKEHLSITQNKLQAGTATDFEVLTTEVRIANAQSQRTDIINALQNQQTMFRQLTGLSQGEPVMLKGDFSFNQISLNSDSLISLAVSQLPEMKLSRISEDLASIQTRLATLSDRPSLGALFQFGFKNGYEPNLNRIKANWVAGAQINVPIFSGFMNRGRESQARANLSAAQLHTMEIKRRVISGVEQAISGVKASQEKLATSEPQVQQAEQALALAQTRYKAGTATNLDVLDAETALASSQLIHLRAQFDLVRNYSALERAIGMKIWEK